MDEDQAPKRHRALTVKETAKELRMGLNQVYQGIHNGEIPSIRIGKKILVPSAGLDRLLGDR